jgi:hypothetical protein
MLSTQQLCLDETIHMPEAPAMPINRHWRFDIAPLLGFIRARISPRFNGLHRNELPVHVWFVPRATGMQPAAHSNIDTTGRTLNGL